MISNLYSILSAMDVDMDDASTKMIRLRNTNRHCDEERPRSQKPTADMQENTYRQENHIRKTSSKQRICGKTERTQ